MHDIAQKQTFFFKLPELDLDPDLMVNFPDPDPAKRSGSGSGFGSATLQEFPDLYLSFLFFLLQFIRFLPLEGHSPWDGGLMHFILKEIL
jgi:hypothetical protein